MNRLAASPCEAQPPKNPLEATARAEKDFYVGLSYWEDSTHLDSEAFLAGSGLATIFFGTLSIS